MVKSAVKEWFDGLKGELAGELPGVTLPVVMKIGEFVLRLIAAFVLSGAEVFGSWRPFALGLTAASGTGTEGLFALLGAGSGFVLLGGLETGVRYVAAVVLIAAMGFLLKDLEISKTQWFAPLLAGVMTAVVGFIFLLDQGLSVRGLLMFMGEAGAVAACTYLFRAALENDGGIWRKAGLLLLAAGLIMALAPVKILGLFSPGRIAGAAAALIAAQTGGWAAGAAMGLAAGAAADAASTELPFFAVTCGLSGLIAGLCRGSRRTRPALGYLVTTGVCLLWMADFAPVSCMAEALLVSIVFVLLPEKLMPKPAQLEKAETETAGRIAVRRLTETAAVFTELFESVSAALSVQGSAAAGMPAIFDRTAERVCRKCMMRSICWERDCQDTHLALNDATAKLAQRGYAEAQDFPPWFASRCRNLPKFISTLNEELIAMNYRRRYEKKAQEDRLLVASQYRELSAMLNRAAERTADTPGYEPRLRRKLEKYLKTTGSPASCSVYRDGFGRLNAEVYNLSGEEALLLHRSLCRLLNVRFTEPRQVAGGAIFTEAERFVPKVGITAKCRKGEAQSGDYGTWFRDGSGQLYLILSDGRGTGKEAGVESASAVRVLEKLIRAGASPESAVRTLNSAYILRGGGGGFATVDLLNVDLFTGRTEMIKWGAAPTYIRSGGRVRRLGSPGSPPGTGRDYEKQVFILNEGDFVVMCSDGLADRDEDNWLIAMIGQYEGGSPRELASRLAAVAEQTRGLEDDMTVMAFCVEES